MQTLWQDVRLAVRFLKKSPAFAIPAVLTLALGIGANATVFSLADGLLFRTLPVPDADRIVHVFQRRTTVGPYPISYADYLEYRSNAQSFEALAAHYPTSPMHGLFGGEPAAMAGAVVTASYFDVLQLQPAAGRFFTTEEDTVRDRDAVAVISDSLWARQFSRAPSALGSVVQLNGRAFTIIGVAPTEFTGVHPRGVQTDVWIPSAMFGVGYRYCNAFERGCRVVEMLGKLRAGVEMSEAQRELDVLASRLETAFPTTNKGLGITVVPARGLGRGPLSEERRQVQLFLGVVTLVLLIACANIAGLLLARASGRRREIAIRLALGAGRGRLVRQLLVESILLAIAGGTIGLLFAVWGNAALDALYARDSAGRLVDSHLVLSGTVLVATTAVTACAALLFGLAPSLAATRPDVVTVLKDEGSMGGVTRARWRKVLVTGQLALSAMLLVGTGLLIQSVRHLHAGPGFPADHIALLRLRPSLIDYPFDRAHAYQQEVVRRVESIPGVISASPGSYLSLMGAGARTTVSRGAADTTEPLEAIGGHVGPRFFSTIGLRLIEGREFSEADGPRAPAVAIVNDVLARKLWPGGHVAGQAVLLNGRPHTIVGVVPDAEYYAGGETPNAQVFFSYWQSAVTGDSFLKDSRLHVRVAGDARAMLPEIRREIAAIDRNVPIVEDYALIDRVAFAYQPVRIARAVLAGFAVLALVLSVVGLYGVLTVIVNSRTREIGVRVALGASRGQVCSLILREAMGMTVAGAVLGILAAWSASRFLASLLYGVETSDLGAFAIAPATLLVVAAVATFVPARRAVKVSPMTALRGEFRI